MHSGGTGEMKIEESDFIPLAVVHNILLRF